MKHKIITLCGSIRYEKEFHEWNKKLTLQGHVVFSCGVFGTDEKNREMLDSIHQQKIDMSDEIFIINPGGYYGKHTNDEIDYARAKGIKFNFLEDL